MNTFAPLDERTKGLIFDILHLDFPNAHQILLGLDYLEAFTCQEPTCQRVVFRPDSQTGPGPEDCTNVVEAHHDAPVRGVVKNGDQVEFVLTVELDKSGGLVAIDSVIEGGIGSYYGYEDVTWSRTDIKAPAREEEVCGL